MALAQFADLTLEIFLQLPHIEDSPAWEYINGIAIQKPMGGAKHSLLQKRLLAAIDQASNLYEAFPELRCSIGGRSVVPDISVLPVEQLPLNSENEMVSTGITFAPIWVIEILSPNQSQTKVTGNILHCLRHGSQLGWLLDPEERSLLVYQPDRLPDLLTGTASLPTLPNLNLTLTVDQVFGWLRREKVSNG